MKHTIWQNIDLNVDDWKDAYREFLEINDIDSDPDDENAIYDFMVETNNEYLDDEKRNLDQKLQGRIVILADLGLWNGRKNGYKILGKNLNEIFSIGGFDYADFYGDRYDIRCDEIHHDGTNHYLFREIREEKDAEKFLNKIYNGEEISRKTLNYYTKSIRPEVAKIYGWE